jgi:hypothetical protein
MVRAVALGAAAALTTAALGGHPLGPRGFPRKGGTPGLGRGFPFGDGTRWV